MTLQVINGNITGSSKNTVDRAMRANESLLRNLTYGVDTKTVREHLKTVITIL